mmetsp:Transcript_57421/g.171286  ORF Transcript_57421/g.171286 Transcript_57421/m.171286 type:complete len:262 (+) Transcript_57421:994-1779(+)
MIAGDDGCDALPHGFHDAPGLMAQDAGEETLGVAPIEGVDVGVAESVSDDLDANFAGLGRVDGDGLCGQGLLGRAGHHGLACDGLPGRRPEIVRFGRLGQLRPQGLVQSLPVERHVILDERGDKVVGVIKPLPLVQLHPLTALLGRLDELVALQLLLEEIVVCAHVNEDGVVLDEGGCAGGEEERGIVVLPGVDAPEVLREGLLPPGTFGGVGDGREGADAHPRGGVAEGDGKGTVSSHAVTSDGLQSVFTEAEFVLEKLW